MFQKKSSSIYYLLYVFIIWPLIYLFLALIATKILFLLCDVINKFQLLGIEIDNKELVKIGKPMSIMLFFIAFFIMARKRKIDSKAIFGGSRINNYPLLVYWIALAFGYKYISFKYIKIPRQFELLSSNLINEFQVDYGDFEEVKEEHDVEIINENNLHEANILIGDTYLIRPRVINKENNMYYSIIINRKNHNGDRIKDKELVKVLQTEINKIKNQCHIFNLYFYTNPTNTKLIYDNVFHTINDDYLLNIYYENDKHNFTNKKISIKS